MLPKSDKLKIPVKISNISGQRIPSTKTSKLYFLLKIRNIPRPHISELHLQDLFLEDFSGGSYLSSPWDTFVGGWSSPPNIYSRPKSFHSPARSINIDERQTLLWMRFTEKYFKGTVFSKKLSVISVGEFCFGTSLGFQYKPWLIRNDKPLTTWWRPQLIAIEDSSISVIFSK